MLDLNLLLAFEALDETRSVTRAAERLGVRQPAMSAALSRLRVALSDQLFVKVAGAMQPTPRAVHLAPGIARSLRELRAALRDPPFEPVTAARTFTVAGTDYTTLVLLPRVMAAIGREAPAIDLRVIGYDKDDVPDLVGRGEVDLALGVFGSPPGGAVRQFLCSERFVGLARVGHPLVTQGAIPLDVYASAAHALVSVRRDVVGVVDAALDGLGLRRRVALTLPHMLALPSVLAGTDLLAAVPQRVAVAMAGADLQPFELPLTLSPWRIEMLWNPVSRRDPASAWLRAKVKLAASEAGRTSGAPATAASAFAASRASSAVVA